MSRFSDEDQALIALHLAALRRHGWPAAKALGLVAEGMPAGDGQRELEAVAAALGRGERPDPAADPFLSLLAQGEAAGPEALLESVKASQLAWAARRSWRQAALVISAVAVGFGLLGFVAIAVIGVWQENLSGLGTALPAPTQLLFDLAVWAGYLGPAVLVALGVIPWLLPDSLLPGVQAYRGASRLRQFAAAVAAKVPVEVATGPAGLFALPGLSPRYRALGEFLLPRDGAESSARSVAHELQAEAALRTARFFTWFPVLGFGAILFFVVPLVFALFLPLFSLAGAIK
ncbi:MAG: hypothetical protein ACYC8T_24830 [Myxococcaceae bacterium]